MQIPSSLYRLQFNHEFTFSDASEIIPYLAELGITHVYASPVFQAKKGSLHGYDIADPHKLNSELGTRAEFDALTTKVSDYRMGWIQDIVPNHMVIDRRNRLLMELLENGPEVLPLNHFDIEWNHQYESIRGRLLAPILGSTYAECLENGEIRLLYDKNGFSLCYYDHRFPLKIETYGFVLEHELEKLKIDLGSYHSGLIKLLGVLFAIKNLPAANQADARKTQVNFTKAILWELYTSDQAIHDFIDATIIQFNGIRGKPESFSLLDDLHAQQLYKLSFWKVATEELNYRRFFTVNDLISIRVEDEQVFRDTHQFIFELVNQGRINGLRVDHIDGLYDPHTYLERLRRGAPDSYIVVEKILAHDETLPNVWPVQGTTGYDFCNYVNQIFCKPENERVFNSIYRRCTGLRIEYDHLLTDRKRTILIKHMAGDVDNLALLIKGVSGTDRRGSDITLYGLRKALIELMVFFPVYRSYINGNLFSNEDRLHLQKAIADARRTDPALSREFAFIERFLLLKYEPYISDQKKNEWTNVVMRFQQFTGPLMAKGFEDTVLYNFNRLISLNEVGSWPEIFGISDDIFHHFNLKRVRLWPNTINSTSTHDTKRGEDVRARINVLSEIPDEWELHLKNWCRCNRKWKTTRFNHSIPDSNDEYFFYQTLLGTFPTDTGELDIYIRRIQDYMLKAVREAKVHTAWITHDKEYEDGVVSFVSNVLDKSKSVEFFSDFLPFQKKIATYGLYNSLSQCLLKITSPGVCDFYQGTELWDLSMVDPDNRRPVDFAKRIAMLNSIKKLAISEYPQFINRALSQWSDGRIKMFLIYRCNKARQDRSELFQNAAYIPLTLSGSFRDHCIGFARKHENQWAIILVPKFLMSLISETQQPLSLKIWNDTALRLPPACPQDWYNAITGEVITCTELLYVGDVFKTFPAAFLISR